MNRNRLIEALNLTGYNKREETASLNCIKVFKTFLNPKDCDTLVTFFENNNKTDLINWNNKRKSLNICELVKKNKTNKEYKEIYKMIFTIFDAGLKLYLLSLRDKINIKHFEDEDYIITKHMKKRGVYNWNIDRGLMGTDTNKRYLTAILYLNDVDKGGEEEFKYHKLIVKPNKGVLLIAPSDRAFTHKSNVSISNCKYTCTTFFSLI